MKSLIGTNWVDAKSGNVIEVFNPANGKLVDTVPSLSKEEVDAAVDYAYEAQKAWVKRSIVERCEILTKFVELVRKFNAREIEEKDLTPGEVEQLMKYYQISSWFYLGNVLRMNIRLLE